MSSILKQAIEDFYPLFNKLESIVGKPVLIEISGYAQYDYSEKNLSTICLIKTARIISSLNAIVFLLEYGFIVEIGIILRTIKEACADLLFLLENYPDKELTKSQQLYIDEFFSEEFQDFNKPIETARKHSRVSQKKIHAGYARNMSNLSEQIKDEKFKKQVQKIQNPSTHQATTEAILNTLSGFVHYGYRQSLELFGGPKIEFKLSGLLGTSKISEWQEILVTEFFAVYNHFLNICFKFGFEEEFVILKDKQSDFQKYTGYFPDLP